MVQWSNQKYNSPTIELVILMLFDKDVICRQRLRGIDISLPMSTTVFVCDVSLIRAVLEMFFWWLPRSLSFAYTFCVVIFSDSRIDLSSCNFPFLVLQEHTEPCQWTTEEVKFTISPCQTSSKPSWKIASVAISSTTKISSFQILITSISMLWMKSWRLCRSSWEWEHQQPWAHHTRRNKVIHFISRIFSFL